MCHVVPFMPFKYCAEAHLNWREKRERWRREESTATADFVLVLLGPGKDVGV